MIVVNKLYEPKDIARYALKAIYRRIGSCVPIRGMRKASVVGKPWRARVVKFKPNQWRRAVNVLAKDVERLGLRRFSRQVAPLAGARAAEVRAHGIAVRCVEQYRIAYDDCVMQLDLIGKAE